MAQTSSVYHFVVDLSDVDRGVYTQLKLPVALHPSESIEFMATRVLAYVLEYREGIEFSPGIGSPEEPAILARSLDGALLLWVDIGAPSAERAHRAAKAAETVAIYCHRNVGNALENLRKREIHNAHAVNLFAFDAGFIDSLAKNLEKRNELSVSRSEGTLYVVINGETLSTPLTQHSI